MPTFFKKHPQIDPVEVTWRHWLRVRWHNRKLALSWAARHPKSTIQRVTRLPWGRRALRLAIRTHLGRVDVRAMREAMMRMEEDELLGYGFFGPDPRGMDEMYQPASAGGLAFDEVMMRHGHWGGPNDWALALRWRAKGDMRMAAQVRALIDLAEHRPSWALGPEPAKEPATGDTPQETS
ncbi:MAG: hypothetical protein ACR2JV_00035 [Gaiellales bacterium]